MIVYLILFGVILAAFGGYTIYERESAANAAISSYQARLAAADAQLKQAADKATTEAANHITDMEAAYESGQEQARVITQKIYVKGQANVAKDSGLSNPACVMADSSLQLLRSALSGMRSSTDPGELATAVPGTGVAGGRDVQRPVPQQSTEYGTVGTVHPTARPASDAGQVPGSSVRDHPKPKPITP